MKTGSCLHPKHLFPFSLKQVKLNNWNNVKTTQIIEIFIRHVYLIRISLLLVLVLSLSVISFWLLYTHIYTVKRFMQQFENLRAPTCTRQLFTWFVPDSLWSVSIAVGGKTSEIGFSVLVFIQKRKHF